MRFILSALLIVSSLQAFAQDQKATGSKTDTHAGHQMDPKMMEMMQKMKEFATPGEQHKMLASYAGDWTYTSKLWQTPKAKPLESSGTAKFDMILDGRWLRHEFKGEAMGTPFTGLGFIGYNNGTKEFESIFMDTMGTGSMRASGSYDKSKKTLTETGQYYCPIKKGPRDYKGVWTFKDKNSMIYAMYGEGMNGEPEYKHMEVTYKRAK